MKKTIVLFIAVLILIGLGSFVFNESKPSEKEKVKIGYLDIISSAPFYIAQEKKFFEEEGLEVELVKIASANEAYEALVRGDIDFVPSTGILPVLINAPKVGGVVKIASVSSLVSGVTFDKLVTVDEKIGNLKDLEEKKIGVFPGTTPTTFLKLYLKKNNIDVSKIEFIQIPPQNQIGALEAGSINALFGYEPIPTIAQDKNQKMNVLAVDVLADVYPESPLGARLTTEKFMCERKEVFEKVQKAIDRAQDVVTNNRTEYVNIVSQRMSIPTAVLGKISPYLTYPVNEEKVASFEQFLIDNQELKEKTNHDVLINCK